MTALEQAQRLGHSMSEPVESPDFTRSTCVHCGARLVSDDRNPGYGSALERRCVSGEVA